MKLNGPTKDLEIAEQALSIMKHTTSFEEFREHWENFLFRIERAWEYAERTLRDMNGADQWLKPYRKLRKKDSLLAFLKQARNAEIHRTSATISRSLKLFVTEKTGRGFQLNSIASQLEDGTLTIKLNSPDILLDLDANILPSDPEVVRFKNRGKWYNPPREHLQVRIKDVHPVELAERGLSFYKAYVGEAEKWLQDNCDDV